MPTEARGQLVTNADGTYSARVRVVVELKPVDRSSRRVFQ
jgi:hypothetical protein